MTNKLKLLLIIITVGCNLSENKYKGIRINNNPILILEYEGSDVSILSFKDSLQIQVSHDTTNRHPSPECFSYIFKDNKFQEVNGYETPCVLELSKTRDSSQLLHLLTLEDAPESQDSVTSIFNKCRNVNSLDIRDSMVIDTYSLNGDVYMQSRKTNSTIVSNKIRLGGIDNYSAFAVPHILNEGMSNEMLLILIYKMNGAETRFELRLYEFS
jgi:hypothetical protein